MQTTALVVEVLVVGILAAVGLAPAAALLTGMSLSAVWSELASMSLVMQLGMTYSLGVVWNRVCNFVFGPLEGVVRWRQGLGKDEIQRKRIVVSSSASPLAFHLGSTRGMIRIVRSTVLLMAMLLAWNLRGVVSLSTSQGSTVTVPTSVLAGSLLVCLYSWQRLYRGYLLTIDAACEVSEK